MRSVSSERVQAAAVAADAGKVLPSGKVNQWSDNLSDHAQGTRAASAGVGIVTQRKLDALARKAPDLLDKVRAGEMSAHRAAVEAGTAATSTNPSARWLRRNWRT